MRILVAGAFEASSQWAHAINTVKMAQGFAQLGHEVTLVCRRPRRGKVPCEELAELYGLARKVNWVQLPGEVGREWKFAWACMLVSLKVMPDVIYARNFVLPWLASRLGVPTVAESHAPPGNRSRSFRRLVAATHHNSFKLWVTISRHLADHYRSQGALGEKLVVLPDAVDLELFEPPERLPPSPYSGKRSVVAYVGHLYDYKGIPTILNTAKLLRSFDFHLVGGWPEDVSRHEGMMKTMGLSNVVLHGLKPHAQIPPYLWHADILLLPPSAHHPSAAWTSPLKLGEYLASGTPVVATSIPGLKDWLTPKEVRFAEPDNPVALADAIVYALTHREYARRLAQNGRRKAVEFSYSSRTGKVLAYIYGRK